VYTMNVFYEHRNHFSYINDYHINNQKSQIKKSEFW